METPNNNDYKKMIEMITPFIPKILEFKEVSTAGKWCVTSDLLTHIMQ